MRAAVYATRPSSGASRTGDKRAISGRLGIDGRMKGIQGQTLEGKLVARIPSGGTRAGCGSRRQDASRTWAGLLVVLRAGIRIRWRATNTGTRGQVYIHTRDDAGGEAVGRIREEPRRRDLEADNGNLRHWASIFLSTTQRHFALQAFRILGRQKFSTRRGFYKC